MSSTHAIPESIQLPPRDIIALRPDAPLSDSQIDLADRQLRQLARLAAIGMEIAEELRPDHDTSRASQNAKNQLGHAFDKVARAIRQIHALEQEIVGLRAQRVMKVKSDLLSVKKTAVVQSVERSVAKAQPELGKDKRERLLSDLFRGYNDFTKGSVREMVAQICDDLGIEADLSLWDAPIPGADIELPAGYDWIVPANGEKPYTTVMSSSACLGICPSAMVT
jgi:hypothetical protein